MSEDEIENHVEQCRLDIERAFVAMEKLPKSREGSIVITKLQEAELWLREYHRCQLLDAHFDCREKR